MHTEHAASDQQNTSFLSTQGTFSRIGNMLEYKTSLNTILKFEIIQNIFFDHNGITLEINSKRKLENLQFEEIIQHTLNVIQPITRRVIIFFSVPVRK